MAVSGIDHTIKIFSPDANAQYNARKGIGIHQADRGLSSLGFGRRRRARRPSATARPAPAPEKDSDLSDDEDNEVEENGLRSRKAMHEQYQITSQNDMDRKGGKLPIERQIVASGTNHMSMQQVAKMLSSRERYLLNWLSDSMATIKPGAKTMARQLFC